MNKLQRRLKYLASCGSFLMMMFGVGALLGTVRKSAIDDARLQVKGDAFQQGKAKFIQNEIVIGRSLLANDDKDAENCTERGISSFPTFFTNDQRLNGAVVVNIIIAVYLCGVIGYTCSAYFVPSLEVISERLGLQPDVAGATFMAAGSSAPEFFSALIGTFISEDDTGLSAVVGSAAFNVFIIIALVSFCSGRVVEITWWPLIRDCICYVIGILLLAFVMYDGQVHWWEGLILSVLYIGYIILMYFNPKLSAKAQEWTEKSKENESKYIIDNMHHANGYGTDGIMSNAGGDYNTQNLIADNSTSFSGTIGSNEFSGEANEVANGLSHQIRNSTRTRYDSGLSGISEHPERLDRHVTLTPPEGKLPFLLWLIGLPPIVLLYITIPDCRRKGCWKECYMVTFCLASTWLALTSYALYWMIVVIGYTFNIPDTVMGITFLAAGTSVPDAIASVLVARDGFGDMAISNIIGSNIFEIFICLGFLWFLKASIDAPVIIASDGLTFTSLSLLFTVAFIIVAIHFNRWKLDTKMGVICIITYLLFISIAVLRELGILGGVSLPEYCPGPN